MCRNSHSVTAFKIVRCVLLLVMLGSASCAPVAMNTGPVDNPQELPPYALESTYQALPYKYKAQIHVHSYTAENPEDTQDTRFEVEKTYREVGYEIIFLSDHNVVTDDPKVKCDASSGKCILHVPAAESGWACPRHMQVLGINTPRLATWTNDNLNTILGLGITSLFFPPILLGDIVWLASWLDECNDIQGRVDKFTDDGAVVVISHPQSSCELKNPCYDIDELDNLNGFTGIEIWTNSNNSLEYWDHLLSDCARRVWGFASDDCEDLVGGAFNRGWIVVNSNLGPMSEYVGQSADVMRSDILKNIKAGNFISVARSPEEEAGKYTDDLGPQLEISVDDLIITVQTDQTDSLIRFRSSSELLSEATSDHASYTAVGNEYYIRIEVEQRREGVMYTAYSQPIFVVDRNPNDQGAEGRVVITTGTTVSLKFCNDCVGCRFAELESNGVFKIVLPIGYYSYTAYDSGHEGTGAVAVGYTGFEQLTIDFLVKEGLEEK